MGVLGSIVEALVGSMLDAGHDFSFGGVIGSELVGNYDAWRTALALQQLAHQEFGCLGIATALHQNLQHKPVLIDGAPQPMFLASDRDDDLVEMPFIAELAARTSTNLVGEGASEFFCPQPDRLMRNDDPSRCQHVLDHPQAERKPKIQPYGVADDFGRKTMAAVKRISVGHGRPSHIEIQPSLS
jgi:hypothetical protein